MSHTPGINHLESNILRLIFNFTIGSGLKRYGELNIKYKIIHKHYINYDDWYCIIPNRIVKKTE